MNCQRCNGLAVYDDSFVVCTGSSSEVHAWRCVNCGMIVDEVIHRNQQAPPDERHRAVQSSANMGRPLRNRNHISGYAVHLDSPHRRPPASDR